MMRTSEPILNSCDGALVNPKAPSNLGMGKRAQTNLFDLLIGELSSKNALASDFDCVVVIPNPTAPLKIVDHVVGLNPIDMVDLRKVLWVGNEGQSDKAVNGYVFTDRANPQVDRRVSSIADPSSHYSASVRSDTVSRPTTAADSVQASDPTKGAHFVKVSESVHVDVLPFLNAWGIHQAAPSLEKLASVNLMTWHETPVNLA